MKCPKCNSGIKSEYINIQSDIARCSACNNVFVISESLNSTFDYNFNIQDSPNGTWIISDYNNTTIGASTRSAIAFFLVPFMLIWSGASIGGIYGSQIYNAKFDLLLSLFGIPFLIGSIIFWSLALMSIWGKVEITLNSQGGKIFKGIGKVGLKKRFDWADISKISEKSSHFRNSKRGTSIFFEGAKRISFGSTLNDERRYYLISAIRKTISDNGWKLG
ncbi:hypothetical protein OAQ99_00315 [Candidatus Kapabacteria bacterium]|nr:hypothetical protein [Candidatus Kapabacteria bacterium]